MIAAARYADETELLGELAARVGKKEVDLKALLVAEEVELHARASIDLALNDLAGDEALEERSEEGRAVELGLGADAEEMAREANHVSRKRDWGFARISG